MLAPNNDLGAWLYARSPSISTAPGVLLGFEGGANEIIGAVDAAYFPASVFSQFPSPNLEFTVTGTTVPEPGTGMLAASIGLMLVASRLAVTMRSERNARK
jgi:hypothetical protein